MRIAHLWKIGGLLLLVMMIALSLLVKNDLLPVPEVLEGEIKGGYIHGQVYEYIVTPDALVESEEDEKMAMYILKKKDNYWLDGTYAVKVQVEVLATNDTHVAVSLLDHGSLKAYEKKVVRNPRADFNAEQQVRIAE